MGFFDKLLLKKNDKEEISEKDLLKRLDEKGIIYSLSEMDNGYQMTYLDTFDKEKYVIVKDGGKYRLNGKNVSEEEVEETIDKQHKLDNEMEVLLYDPDYEKLMLIYDFLIKAIPKNIITIDFALSSKGDLTLSFSEPESCPFTSIHIDSKTKKLVYDKTREVLNKNNMLIRIIKDIKKQLPLFFDAGEFKIPEQTPFTDVVKTFFVNEALIERLNKTKNIEAKLIEFSGNTTIFIIFKNGSAMEYISPTKQNPTGKLLLMDVDEDTTLEDNEEYWLVQKILKLPSCLDGKPDEDNMPIRNFKNRKSLKV